MYPIFYLLKAEEAMEIRGIRCPNNASGTFKLVKLGGSLRENVQTLGFLGFGFRV